MIPFTVTNSQPYSQLTNNSTWFTTASLTYNFYAVGLKGNQTRLQSSMLFPNPAKSFTSIKFESDMAITGELQVFNLLGSELTSKKFDSVAGETP
jgi:hypothetical protein